MSVSVSGTEDREGLDTVGGMEMLYGNRLPLIGSCHELADMTSFEKV